MNIETIKYISMIAGTAADRVKAGKTLKASKAWLAEAMSEANTPFCHVDGVDFEEVNKRVNLLNALNINTKGGFVRQCETAVTRMAEQHDNVVFANRVQYAIESAAKRHGVVIHAADVIEWANGDIYFNFTKAADALAAEAAPVEPFEVTIKGSVGVDNLFHKGDVIYAGAIEGMKTTVTKMPKVGDIVTATDWRGEVHTRVKVRQVLNDMPPRPAHLQACMDAHHDELFSGFFNDRVKPTRERKEELEDMTHDQIYVAFAAPVPASVVEPDCVYTPDPAVVPARVKRQTSVMVLHTTDGRPTYRIHLDNGRVYLYHEGASFAQIKMPGGKLAETTSAYTLARLRAAVASR